MTPWEITTVPDLVLFSIREGRELARAITPPSPKLGLQTFDEGVVGLGPTVAVVGRQNPNWLLVGLEGRIPDFLQLEEDLVGGQGTPVAAVNVQLKELRERKEGAGSTKIDAVGTKDYSSAKPGDTECPLNIYTPLYTPAYLYTAF